MEQIATANHVSHLTPALLAAVVLSFLSAFLISAVWTDIRQRRIPNHLVFFGAALGVFANSMLPEGNGFASSLPGAVGLLNALYGLGLGLAIMLPLYCVGAMGAGDAKLMAMVGAFLGPVAVIGAILLTFVAGGVMALAVVFRNRSVQRLRENLHVILLNGFVSLALKEIPRIKPAQVSAGNLPYAVAIGLGTWAYIAIVFSGRVNFLSIF